MLCLPSFAKDGSKTFLLKMPVICQHIRNALASHRLHRNAIGQTVALIETRAK